jgi:endonuclease/exonuclease/phosphatase family metal-dependent hydrolase
MRQLFSHAFLIINIVVIAWLFCCYAASVTHPEKVNYLALFSLTTPFAILANVMFAIVWLFSKRRWKALFSTASLLGCYKIIIMVFAFHFFGGNDAKGTNTVKVMSWNAHGLGVFDRPFAKGTVSKMMDYLKAEDPDILCMPEYYTRYDNSMKPYTTAIISNNGFKEFRFNMDNTIGDKIYLGTAIFSKYPFVNYQTHILSQYIYMLQCDMRLPSGSMMRMFFIHLHSFGLSDHDRQYIEEAKATEKPLDSNIVHSKFYMGKFNDAYAKRAKEAELAAEIVAQSPYPVLICGDLNDLPASYTYTTMRGKLNDAFTDKGCGIGRTYNQIFPTLRIDYILYDPAILHIIGYRSPNTILSDHNPVIANFELTNNANN